MNIIKDKYYPSSYADIIYNKKRLKSLINLLSDTEHNNILIYGPKNSGKNVIVNVALNHIYYENIVSNIDANIKSNIKNGIYYKYSDIHYHFYFNLKNKYEDLLPILNDIINCKNHYIDYLDYNIIVFDNFHNISYSFQESLRTLIERNNNIKIIIITNKIHKVNAQIRSRATLFRLPIIQSELITYANHIRDKESLNYADTQINAICHDSNINNVLEDLDTYKLLDDNEEMVGPFYKINYQVMKIIDKPKMIQKDLEKIKELSHTILIISDDIVEYLKSLLDYILSNNIENKYHLNHIKTYKLIQLFSKTDLDLIKSYRKIIFIESLLYNIHNIFIS